MANVNQAIMVPMMLWFKIIGEFCRIAENSQVSKTF
jgi:hypothetical protein